MQDGNKMAVATRLLEIDNAREKVKDGTIRGVNATDTPAGENYQPIAASAYLESL